MSPDKFDALSTTMSIRIKPRQIEIPEDDPFRNDLLSRKEPVEVLTHLVGSLDGPCVLALDAAWGNGKTTFLQIWSQQLRNQRFPVVKFNAWETDVSRDPFVALTTELTRGLQECMDKPLTSEIAATKKAAKEVLRRAVPGVIRIAVSSIPLVGTEMGLALASYTKDRLSGYQEAQKSLRKFRNALQCMAKKLSECSEDRPLVVMIDELDRCRPSYAVELLEVSKHLFAVDHIVFVLAVNRSELAHSIRALYGSNFDATGYLRRFFDVDFRLPDPDRDAFIDAILDATKIKEFFERTQDKFALKYPDLFRKLLKGFFRAPDLSLRRIEQAIHRLGLVLASLASAQRAFAVTSAVMIILRTIDPGLYRRFVAGEASDLDVSVKIFGNVWARALQRENEGRVFEAMIIAAAREQKIIESFPEESINSPLLRQYKGRVAAQNSDEETHNLEREQADRVIKIVKQLEDDLIDKREQFVGFRQVVQRIELLSYDLVGDRE